MRHKLEIALTKDAFSIASLDQKIADYGQLPTVIQLPIDEYLVLAGSDFVIFDRTEMYYKGIRVMVK